MSGSRGAGRAVMASVRETTHPPLFRRHARRPRLTRLLDESTAQAILITAPAGYGKTTLAAEWLQGREDVVWYRATASSADLAAFSAGLADVVAPLVPGAGERLRQRLRVADVPEKAVRPLADLLAQDLAAWPENALLVIDDYHLVADSTPVEEFVDWLLTLSSIRVLVTTRRRPIWASARRVLYGEITEIGRDQLAMTNEEAARVLDSRSSEAVRALVAQAEGWPALIGLAALSASAALPEERMSEALFRYFAEEVFRREPEEVQRLMLLSSIPSTIDVRVSRDVLGFRNPNSLLRQLAERGTLQETESGDLRFHPLLRDFLWRKLEVEDPDVFQQSTARVIEDARKNQDWSEAIDLAIKTARLQVAAEIVGEAAPSLLKAGRLETLDKWLAECGAVALETPAGALVKAEALTRQGRLSAAASLADATLRRLTAQDPWRSRACFLAGQALHLLSEDQRALAYHTEAKRHARTPHDRASALWGCFLAASELELDDAASFLDELQALTGDEVDGRLRIAAGRVLAASRRGSFAGMWEEMLGLVPLADYATDPMVKSSFFARAGELNIALARYGKGELFLNQAIHICDELQLDFATALCLELRAITEIGLRRFRAVRQTLGQLIQLSRDQEDPYVELACQKLDIQLALGEGAAKGLTAGFQATPKTELQRSGAGEYHALRAIAAACIGNSKRAKEEALRAREVTDSIEATFYSRWAELIAAFANTGPSKEVIAETSKLVALARRHGFIHSFVVAYRAYPRILELVAADRKASQIAREVLASVEDEALERKYLGAKTAGAPSDQQNPLTDREHEVLLLMAEGLSNADIAARLFISPSTAKVHVHHILEKAGAANRLQAVRKLERLLN
jgi:LuxR family transcriptional regulator, maltose regulon positive regulatory protein